MTPQHAKLFMNALRDNLAKYEMQYGEISSDKNFNIFPGFNDPPKVN